MLRALSGMGIRIPEGVRSGAGHPRRDQVFGAFGALGDPKPRHLIEWLFSSNSNLCG